MLDVQPKGIRMACAHPELADWLEKRYEKLWSEGWKTDEWSRYVSATECLAVAPATIREAIEEMPDGERWKAAISYERVTIAEKSVRVAA